MAVGKQKVSDYVVQNVSYINCQSTIQCVV